MFLLDGLNFNQGDGETIIEDFDVAALSYAEIFGAPMHLIMAPSRLAGRSIWCRLPVQYGAISSPA